MSLYYTHTCALVTPTEGSSVKEPVMELQEGEMYSQGNHAALMKHLQKVTGKDKPKVSECTSRSM